MTRRSFSAFLSTLAPAAVPLSSSAQSTALRTPTSSSTLPVPPNHFIQHLLKVPDGFYFTVYSRSAKTTTLAHSSFTGRSSIIGQLPEDVTFYSALGIRKSGNLILPCARRGAGFGVREFDRSANQVRAFDLPLSAGGGVVDYSVVGDSLFMLRSGGSADVLDLNSAKITSYPSVLPEHGGVCLFPTSDRTILIVDLSNARLCSFDISNGAKSVISLNAPELTSGRQYFAGRARLKPTGAQSAGSPLMILPSAPDGANGVYCIVYPILRKQGAPVLRFSQEGSVLDRFLIALPEETATASGLPGYLVVANESLLLVYRSGVMAMYEA